MLMAPTLSTLLSAEKLPVSPEPLIVCSIRFLPAPADVMVFEMPPPIVTDSWRLVEESRSYELEAEAKPLPPLEL
jgi:hypothetical protein